MKSVEDTRLSASWWSLLARREVWGIILGRLLTDCVWWFYVYWLPKYLSDARGFSLSQIGLFAWIPFLAVDFGNLGGGWFSGRLLRRGFTLNAARKIVLVFGALGMVAGLPAGFAGRGGEAGACIRHVLEGIKSPRALLVKPFQHIA